MKGTVLLACSLVGGVAGGLLVKALPDRDEPVRTVRTSAAAPETPAPATEALESRLEAIERRLAAMEGFRESAPASAEGGGSGAPAGGSAAGEASPAAAGASAKEVIAPMLGKPFGNAEANAFFGWLFQNKERVDDAIRELEAQVSRDPQNADLRVALATAYVAKLLNVPPGPQQGQIWAFADAAYDAAIERNPEHWQARFGKAFGTSQIPAFLGQRPAAIRQFEELLERQERVAPQPYHVNTYFQLGNLYKDAGNVDKAREVWQRGLRQFPDNQAMKEAIEVIEKR